MSFHTRSASLPWTGFSRFAYWHFRRFMVHHEAVILKHLSLFLKRLGLPTPPEPEKEIFTEEAKLVRRLVFKEKLARFSGLPTLSTLKLTVAKRLQTPGMAAYMKYARGSAGLEEEKDLTPEEDFRQSIEEFIEGYKVGKTHPRGMRAVAKMLGEHGTPEGCGGREVNVFLCTRFNRYVTVWEYWTPTQRKIAHHVGDVYIRHGRRYRMFLHSYALAGRYTVAQEKRALKKLRSLVTKKQYEKYLVTGTFDETSKRSGVTYYFRKSKPTVAVKERVEDGKSVCHYLTSLCLHPQAYHEGTFVGSMTPTDDVISHLCWMRSDERRFWGKSNHHSFHEVENGLP